MNRGTPTTSSFITAREEQLSAALEDLVGYYTAVQRLGDDQLPGTRILQACKELLDNSGVTGQGPRRPLRRPLPSLTAAHEQRPQPSPAVAAVVTAKDVGKWMELASKVQRATNARTSAEDIGTVLVLHYRDHVAPSRIARQQKMGYNQVSAWISAASQIRG